MRAHLTNEKRFYVVCFVCEVMAEANFHSYEQKLVYPGGHRVAKNFRSVNRTIGQGFAHATRNWLLDRDLPTRTRPTAGSYAWREQDLQTR